MALKLSQKALKILDKIIDLPAEAQAAALEKHCGEDKMLRQAVQSLLAVETASDSEFLGASAAAVIDDAGEEVSGHIGPYRIQKRIGYGGMGNVYLAIRDDDQYQNQVAIKVIKKGMDSEEILQRFKAERQILAGLNHPNIARLIDGGMTKDNMPYFIMEYVGGKTIDEYCDEQKLTIRERLLLFRKVCAAVQYAHQNLIVHRDLKPGNILIDENGEPKLLDFGIAKLLDPDVTPFPVQMTAAHLRVMTPEYASPEQVQGKTITTASDVYALGILLYELLTGRRPYRISSRLLEEIKSIVCNEAPARPSTAISKIEEILLEDGVTAEITLQSVSEKRGSKPETLRRSLAGDVDNIVLMALRKEPGERYASVEQFSEDIRRHLSGLPVIARRATAGYRIGKFIQRHKIGVISTLAFIILLIGFSVYSRIQADRIAGERDKAEEVTTFLIDIFKLADPTTRPGEEITVSEVLENATDKIYHKLGKPTLLQARMMVNIAHVYQNLGIYDESLKLNENALKIRKANLPGDHLDMAESFTQTAQLFFLKGQYMTADSLWRKALGIREKEFGTNHPLVAKTMGELALAVQASGKIPEAEDLLRKSISILETVNDEKSADLAKAQANYANLLFAKGDYAKAESVIQIALEQYQKIYGEEDPQTLNLMNSLASILYMQAKLDVAEKHYRKVIKLRKKIYGEDHPLVIRVISNLAGVFFVKTEYDSAIALFQKTYNFQEQLLGESHPDVLRIQNNLGTAYQNKGDYKAAREIHEAVLIKRRQTLGEAHPDVAESLFRLGEVAHAEKQLDIGEKYFKQALKINRNLPANQPGIGNVLFSYGRLLKDKKDYKLAENYLRECAGIFGKILPPKHQNLAEVLCEWADCFVEMQQYEAAEKLFATNFPILQKAYPATDFRVVRVAGYLTKLYEKMDNQTEAEKYRQLIENY